MSRFCLKEYSSRNARKIYESDPRIMKEYIKVTKFEMKFVLKEFGLLLIAKLLLIAPENVISKKINAESIPIFITKESGLTFFKCIQSFK